MATLRILVPEATTNHIKNPQFRYDTTGWNAVGSTLTRILTRARFGVAALQVVTNGSAVNEGAYYRVKTLQGISDQVTNSIYVRGTGTVRVRLIANPTGKQWVSKPVVLTDTRWKRIYVTGQSIGSDDIRLYVETAKDTAQAVTFYVDGAQMEQKPHPTTYCDGDQRGCMWAGVHSNSLSSRSAEERSGGQWISLADDPDLYFTVIGGLGVPPIRNNFQSYGDGPGSYYQDFKTLDRVTTITFHTKNDQLGVRTQRKSLEKLHALRSYLWDIIKPDKKRGRQEFVIEYQDGDIPVYMTARYDGGMEGEWDVRNYWVNSFPVRFLSVSPYIVSDNYEAASLNFRDRITVNYAMARIDGQWQSMNGGMNGQIYQFEIGKRGEIYAVGSFTRSNFSASSIDPEIYTNFVSYWDGTQWQQLGSGANGIINSVAIAPNGNVYVTGEFTSIGGVAANRIAYWNGSAWNAIGTGLGNGAGFSIKVAPNGDVYVGGSFTLAGGTNCYYCAYWDGFQWRPLGVEDGVNDSVYSVDISDDGTEVYLGGAFTDEFGSPGNLALNRVGLYRPARAQFEDMGDGFDGLVRKIVHSPSGTVYACGDFTASGAVIPDTMLYVAYWNGTAWFALGIGADNIIRDMDVDQNGNAIVAGDFTVIGSVESQYVALWNGSSWVNIDAEVDNACRAVKYDRYGNIFLSPGGSNANIAKRTTVTNTGKAETYPLIYVVGPCTLKWVENQSASKRLYADMDILQNEEVFIDFSKGTIFSTVRGNLAYAIGPGSDIRSWKLIPDDNVISVLMTDDTGATIHIYHAPLLWSADNTAITEDV